MTTVTAPDGTEILPGTIGLTLIGGEVGKLIHLGQFLAETPADEWLKPDDEPPYEHAFVYLGDGKIIEAEPGGARIADVTEYSTVYWCTHIAAQFTPAAIEVASHSALDFEGVKYSFLDYFALAARRLYLFPLYPLLKRRVASSKHMICSQLCDAAYRINGMQIFKDKRWPGDVMPMDLYIRDQQLLLLKQLLVP
jgi:hypothetical protein